MRYEVRCGHGGKYVSWVRWGVSVGGAGRAGVRLGRRMEGEKGREDEGKILREG